MAEVHAQIERLFERWGRFVFAHPWLVIIGMAVLTAFFASGLPSLEMTASTESYLQEHDESREVFRIQRELLKVSRDQDAGKQQADADLAAFQTAANDAVETTAITANAIDQAFRG